MQLDFRGIKSAFNLRWNDSAQVRLLTHQGTDYPAVTAGFIVFPIQFQWIHWKRYDICYVI